MNDQNDPLLDDDFLDEEVVVNEEVEQQQEDLHAELDAVEEAPPLPGVDVEPEDIGTEIVDDVEDAPASPVEEPVAASYDSANPLAALAAAGEMTVLDFRAALNLGNEARYVLETLVGQGLVQRTWRASKGRYSLTDAGRAAAEG